MKKYLILFVLLVSGFSLLQAETKSYKIDITAPQLKNDTLNLAMYFYGKLYSRDTLALDARGNGSFQKNDRELEQGIYVIYFSQSKYFEILVADDQHFKIQIDTTDLVNKVYISGAEQTEKFTDYLKFLSTKKSESTEFMKKYESTKDTPETKKIISDRMDQLDKEVKNYQLNLVNTYSGKPLGIVMKSLIPMEEPEFQAENDSIKQVKRYYYARAHYFDNYDMSSPVLLRTGFLPPKIDFYLQKMLPQNLDTLNNEVVRIIEMTRGDTLTYKNMLSHMLNYSVKSNIMGMDKILMTLADKYYLSGQAPWADSTLLKDLASEVKKMRYNQLGDPAHNLKVETIDGKQTSLYAQPQDYILVYFYEPSCGHCKKETPQLYNTLYQKYKDNNFFQVFAFYIQLDRKEWEEFINEHGMTEWLNVWDPTRQSEFWHYYDTSATPGVYLINKDRKFIAKKVDLETLDKILAAEKERNKE